jgi:GH15 family glucan-1,4-alpha-glucosidase
MSDRYPPLACYGLLSDCHTAALVSPWGAVDWCCLPRFDSASTFGRLLDWERGGHWTIGTGERAERRDYLDGTLVLATTFATPGGEARLLDCLVAPPSPRRNERRRLLRVVEGVSGEVTLGLRLSARFDFGHMGPWLRDLGGGAWSATGGDDGLVVWSEAPLRATDERALEAEIAVRAGERVRTLATFVRPEDVDDGEWERPAPSDADRMLDETVAWWREFSGRLDLGGSDAVRRSALVLRGLQYEPTGAMIAAPTTSLPEAPGSDRNWDYRYSWLRDSMLASGSLADVGCEGEADAFRRFVERAVAGEPADMRILYGVGGERRLAEHEVSGLEGWRGSGPVRTGNAAGAQLQLDSCGEVVESAWRWLRRGHPPRDDHWDFLWALVDSAVERWRKPDAGIWEWRGPERHFVHSKVLAWATLERGLALADESGHEVPRERWRSARDEIREAVETDGVDRERGVFVQAFGARDLDAALLRLPSYGFVDWDDERMVRTVDAVERELGTGDGLVRRYAVDDGLGGEEGAFLACSFWLAEALARQGRGERARRVYERALAAAGDLGLMAEQVDVRGGELLGNHPQALTHLSHIEAAMALAGA